MDVHDFKQALAQWVAGVTVVAAKHEQAVGGMTVSSFTSVSTNPFLILVSITKAVYTHTLIEASGAFAVSILHVGQVDWAKRFAGFYPEIEDRFFDIDYVTAVTGSPILPGAIAWVDCRVQGAYEAGDHTIFVSEVVAAQGKGNTPPLLYHDRTWGEFAPLPVGSELK